MNLNVGHSLCIFVHVVYSLFRLSDNSVHFLECSPFLGRYFYNMYIVKLFEIVFSLMFRTIIYVHVFIILDFPITYRNASGFFSIRMRMST